MRIVGALPHILPDAEKIDLRGVLEPLPGPDLIAQGMGRITHVTGAPGGPPTAIKISGGVRVRAVALKLGQHNAEMFGRLGVSEASRKA